LAWRQILFRIQKYLLPRPFRAQDLLKNANLQLEAVQVKNTTAAVREMKQALLGIIITREACFYYSSSGLITLSIPQNVVES
jgi:hypothetical protein